LFNRNKSEVLPILSWCICDIKWGVMCAEGVLLLIVSIV